jgi:hypothetical protein
MLGHVAGRITIGEDILSLNELRTPNTIRLGNPFPTDGVIDAWIFDRRNVDVNTVPDPDTVLRCNSIIAGGEAIDNALATEQPEWSPITALLNNKGAALSDGIDDGLVAQTNTRHTELHTGTGMLWIGGLCRTVPATFKRIFVTISSGSQEGIDVYFQSAARLLTRIAHGGSFIYSKTSGAVFSANTPFEIAFTFVDGSSGNEAEAHFDNALVTSGAVGTPAAPGTPSTRNPEFFHPSASGADFGIRAAAILGGMTDGNRVARRNALHDWWVADQGL